MDFCERARVFCFVCGHVRRTSMRQHTAKKKHRGTNKKLPPSPARGCIVFTRPMSPRGRTPTNFKSRAIPPSPLPPPPRRSAHDGHGLIVIFSRALACARSTPPPPLRSHRNPHKINTHHVRQCASALAQNIHLCEPTRTNRAATATPGKHTSSRKK